MTNTAGFSASSGSRAPLSAQADAAIDGQIANQPGAVSVVAQKRVVGLSGQCVHRSGTSRTFGQAVSQLECLLLEWHRHVAATAGLKEPASEGRKIVQWCQGSLVIQLLCGLFGKQPMDQR